MCLCEYLFECLREGLCVCVSICLSVCMSVCVSVSGRLGHQCRRYTNSITECVFLKKRTTFPYIQKRLS